MNCHTISYGGGMFVHVFGQLVVGEFRGRIRGVILTAFTATSTDESIAAQKARGARPCREAKRAPRKRRAR